MKTYTQWFEQNAPVEPIPMNAMDNASQQEITLLGKMKAILPSELQDLANSKTKGIVIRILTSLANSNMGPADIKIMLSKILRLTTDVPQQAQQAQQNPQQAQQAQQTQQAQQAQQPPVQPQSMQ